MGGGRFSEKSREYLKVSGREKRNSRRVCTPRKYLLGLPLRKSRIKSHKFPMNKVNQILIWTGKASIQILHILNKVHR